MDVLEKQYEKSIETMKIVKEYLIKIFQTLKVDESSDMFKELVNMTIS